MILLSDNAGNVSTFRKSKLLRNPTFSHVLRNQTFGVNRFSVNRFEDSQHTFLFNTENAVGILLEGSTPFTLNPGSHK